MSCYASTVVLLLRVKNHILLRFFVLCQSLSIVRQPIVITNARNIRRRRRMERECCSSSFPYFESCPWAPLGSGGVYWPILINARGATPGKAWTRGLTEGRWGTVDRYGSWSNSYTERGGCMYCTLSATVIRCQSLSAAVSRCQLLSALPYRAELISRSPVPVQWSTGDRKRFDFCRVSSMF